MSYSGLLINRCNVVRPSIATSHGTKDKTYNTGSPDVVDLRCRIQFFSSMAVTGGGSLEPTPHGYETVEGYFGFFEYGVSILLGDLLIDEKGRQFIVVSVPLDVSGMKHHVECRLALREPPQFSTPITKEIDQGTDDGEKWDAGYGDEWDDTTFGYQTGVAGSRNVCLRFRSINIPQGATIVVAYIQLYLIGIAAICTEATCYGVDEDNTITFADDPFARPVTTALANFDGNQWASLVLGAYRNSPSIKDIIQEIVNRSGWVAGNALGFFILNDGTTDGCIIAFWPYEGPAGTSPRLVIEWTT